MKLKFGLLIFLLIALTGLLPASAQCTPFTTAPQSDMLPIDTQVSFAHWEGGMGAVTITGVVEEYYIMMLCPQAALINMDAKTYVVYYGDPGPYHLRVILNRDQMTVLN